MIFEIGNENTKWKWEIRNENENGEQKMKMENDFEMDMVLSQYGRDHDVDMGLTIAYADMYWTGLCKQSRLNDWVLGDTRL